jgi:hypothetical protein
MIPARAVVVAMLSVVVLGACGRDDESSEDRMTPPPPPATAPNGAIVFPLPEDADEAIKRADLTPQPEDATGYRIRAHLDVIINGRNVTVPAGLGVDAKNTRVAPVHTADDSGIVQVHTTRPEDPAKPPPTFRVSQLFQLWGVKLDKSCIADYCVDEDHQLVAYVNGELAAEPTAVPITDGAQIVLWYGPRDTNPAVPISYAFP